MVSCPGPFSEIGKKAKDLLTKDYNFDQKFTLMMLSDTGLGITTTGVKKDQLFVGDISTLYKSGNTTVNVKVDTDSNVATTVTVNEIFPRTKTAFSFKIPDHKSGKVAATVTVSKIFSCKKIALRFKIPDRKSGKLEVQYLHHHATINSNIGLTPTPLLELAASIGSKEISLGGEVAFNTATSSFTKCNAGIGLSKHDFSASLILGDKGETLKASYIHTVDPINSTAVAAEMTHRFTTYENSFTIGASRSLDPFTVAKARLNHNGKVAMLCQREWRPKSLVTVSAEFDPKAVNGPSKFGLALALKP